MLGEGRVQRGGFAEKKGAQILGNGVTTRMFDNDGWKSRFNVRDVGK